MNIRRKIIDFDDKRKLVEIRPKNEVKNDIMNKNNSIYKKIENNDSNKNSNSRASQIFNSKNKDINNAHTSQLLNDKDKSKSLPTNKQKNMFLNSKYSHANRIINLKSLNGFKNSNDFKDSFLFNKYNNNYNNNNKIGLNKKFKKEHKYISAFDGIFSNNRNNSEEMNSAQNTKSKDNKTTSPTTKQNIYNPQLNIKKFLINEDTPSGSTLACSKKYNSNSINNQNLTEDHNIKFRIGLLSAFSNSNNNTNIIIPILPLQRPLSNFNLGGGQLWENIDNNNMNKNIMNSAKLEQNKKQLNINKKLINNINIIGKNKANNREKIGTAPIQKRNEFSNYFSNIDKNKKILNKNYSNFFSNMSNYGVKFHHIKIDKSLMNNKIADSLNKNIILNYINLEQNQLPKIRNTNYNEIKKLHNLRNNST